MTYRDYLKWAREYEKQVQVINEKLERRSKLKYFASTKERADNEQAILQLKEMRAACLRTCEILKEKAYDIQKAEENEKIGQKNAKNRRTA